MVESRRLHCGPRRRRSNRDIVLSTFVHVLSFEITVNRRWGKEAEDSMDVDKEDDDDDDKAGSIMDEDEEAESSQTEDGEPSGNINGEGASSSKSKKGRLLQNDAWTLTIRL